MWTLVLPPVSTRNPACDAVSVPLRAKLLLIFGYDKSEPAVTGVRRPRPDTKPFIRAGSGACACA